jgi:hypothetical protein
MKVSSVFVIQVAKKFKKAKEFGNMNNIIYHSYRVFYIEVMLDSVRVSKTNYIWEHVIGYNDTDLYSVLS